MIKTKMDQTFANGETATSESHVMLPNLSKRNSPLTNNINGDGVRFNSAIENNDTENAMIMRKSSKDRKCCRLPDYTKIIASKLEQFFLWYGTSIATYPTHYIIISLLLCTLSGLGLLRLETENRPFKLWIPQNSDFIKVSNWQKINFPSNFRFNAIVYEADNVLNKTVLQEIFKIHQEIASTNVSYFNKQENVTKSLDWVDVCAKVPSVDAFSMFRNKRDLNYAYSSKFNSPVVSSESTLFNRSSYHRNFLHYQNSKRLKRQLGFIDQMPQFLYCNLIERLEKVCLEKSVLETWGYDSATYEGLSNEQIIKDINDRSESAIFGSPTNFSDYLGGVTYDDQGRIIAAKASIHTWFTKNDPSKIIPGEYIDEFGTGVEVNPDLVHWEGEVLDKLLNISHRLNGVNIYIFTPESFSKVSDKAIRHDMLYLIVGYSIVFLFVQIMLGKFNLVETRPLLSVLGIVTVQLAVLVSYGVASLLSKFGPMNHILPFLLLGLGIDDMFVIVQAYDNLSPAERSAPVQARIGTAMKHAGVSITVTSLTDIVAFAIGSLTVLPALRSFCIYAAVGIGAVYLLQATLFVAFFSLDQRRMDSRRNGILCCYKMSDNYVPNRCSQRDLCKTFFEDFYGKLLVKWPMKVLVLMATATLFGFSCYGAITLKQEFNSIWFLPQDSYLFEFFMKQIEYFPNNGETGSVFIANAEMPLHLDSIEHLVRNLKSSPYIGSVDDWYTSFKNYYEDKDYVVPDPDGTRESFYQELGEFLYSPSGFQYRDKNFRFLQPPQCDTSAPQVLVSSLEFRYRKFDDTSQKQAAMASIKRIVRDAERRMAALRASAQVRADNNLITAAPAVLDNSTQLLKPIANLTEDNSTRVFVSSKIHSSWETDQIIEHELYRNIFLALVVVFFMTISFIGSLVQSILVLVSLLVLIMMR